MKFYKNPSPDQWSEIAERPLASMSQLRQQLQPLLEDIRNRGDNALRHYTRKFDNVMIKNFKIDSGEFDIAEKSLTTDLKNAIKLATENISKFHESQKESIGKVETAPGVTCWRKNVGIERVGLYIPGGSAPLFSSILMLGIPAKIAGCREIILCTPPRPDGSIHPAILYSASLVGISEVFRAGGAQAVAAMAYGTESIPKVDKIFGPGNQYVTAAKQLVSLDGVAIDLPAGPSEVLIIADEGANPAYLAADLLSQAEHGTDSQVVLLTTSNNLIEQVKAALINQLEILPRRNIAEQSLEHSRILYFNTLEECMEFSNFYAPEHLIIMTENYQDLAEKITSAGSVFLGPLTPESAGDYASGTNHTLPTGAYARSYSGVSLDSFVKKITFQELTSAGLEVIGPAIEIMAAAEDLDGHRNAVRVRLHDLRKGTK
jgi:histidinol dehydrogenase